MDQAVVLKAASAKSLACAEWQALKMTVKGDCLFIEAGGNAKNPVGWKSPLLFMKKK